MRLHKLIEKLHSMKLAGSYVLDERFEKIAMTAHGADGGEGYTPIKEFDFGDVSNIPHEERVVLEDFSIELAMAGLFHLAFPGIVFSWKDRAFDGDLYEIVAVVIEKSPTDFVCTTYIVRADGAIMGFAGTYAVGEDGKTRAQFKFSLVKTGQGDPQAGFASLALETLWLNAMLSARGTEIHVDPAPLKLNIKRVARGKPPINEIRTVRIRVGNRLYSPSGHDSENRSSPRLHWRRGHLRQIGDGALVPVRPCLVGNAGERAPLNAHYKVIR